MDKRRRYTEKTYAPEAVRRRQRAFFEKAGPSLRLMIDLLSNAPGIALTIKDARGRIMHTNRFNAQISGWASPDVMVHTVDEPIAEPGSAWTPPVCRKTGLKTDPFTEENWRENLYAERNVEVG